MQSNLQAYLRERLGTSTLNDEMKAFLCSERPLIIYGAGRQARIVIDFCKMFQKTYSALMTTDNRERWGMLPQSDAELPLYFVNEFPYIKSEYDVVIAVDIKFADEIRFQLNQHGYSNIYLFDWKTENDKVREFFYDSYLKYHNAEVYFAANGERYLKYDAPFGEFRLCYPTDRVFCASTLGAFNDIVMPSVFGDNSVLDFGPYEWGNVRINPGDTVLDLGATVGLFSCVAAAKGCQVYAFEPAEYVVKDYLLKNLVLYDNITLVQKALGDKTGALEFYYNDFSGTDIDISRNSRYPGFEPGYHGVTTVEEIRLDDWVYDNNIKKIDFIKSFTEYSEPYIIDGAAEVLREFAPKLSLHASVTQKEVTVVIEKILKINPKYKIEHKWRRLFCWVEGE